MIKVLHLNYDSSNSKLSFPHILFHKEFLALGFESQILSLTGDYQDHNVIYLKNSFFKIFDISKIVRKVLFNFRSKYYFYPDWNTNLVSVKNSICVIGFSPDLIFVYWTKFAFNFNYIEQLSKYYDAHVVFVLLDMGHLTGGCHYSFDCTNYISGCGYCPVMPFKTINDLSSMVIKNRRNSLMKLKASILAPTTMLLKQSQDSFLFGHVQKFLVPFPVNEEVFIDGSRILARQKLKLPLDKKIILFGASKLSEPRKGIKLLVECLSLVSQLNKKSENQNILLLIIGKMDINLELPFQHESIGYQYTEENLSIVFQACDCFLSPSVEDSGPLMVNFSLMCGRPVVAFNIGVAIDCVINDSTGYLASLYNVSDFAKGISLILNLDKDKWDQYSANCRQLALSRFSRKIINLELLKLAKNLVKN